MDGSIVQGMMGGGDRPPSPAYSYSTGTLGAGGGQVQARSQLGRNKRSKRSIVSSMGFGASTFLIFVIFEF